MKIILSRKGMDSSWGGHPGVILSDNTLLYYPIPGDEDEECYSSIQGVDGIPMDVGMRRFYPDILYHDTWKQITSQADNHLIAIILGIIPALLELTIAAWQATCSG